MVRNFDSTFKKIHSWALFKDAKGNFESSHWPRPWHKDYKWLRQSSSCNDKTAARHDSSHSLSVFISWFLSHGSRLLSLHALHDFVLGESPCVMFCPCSLHTFISLLRQACFDTTLHWQHYWFNLHIVGTQIKSCVHFVNKESQWND